mmetsp:Transcript_6191/g.17863  ORF Transcript_6191/g.17863 Transcript_6191/m.17863 type:complete len:115 (-) Transcript_6191:94-438(-)
MFALGDLVFTCVMHEYMTEVACFVGFVMGYFIIGPSARRRNRSWRVLAASRLERVMRPAIAADGARARTAMSAMAASQFEPKRFGDHRPRAHHCCRFRVLPVVGHGSGHLVVCE